LNKTSTQEIAVLVVLVQEKQLLRSIAW